MTELSDRGGCQSDPSEGYGSDCQDLGPAISIVVSPIGRPWCGVSDEIDGKELAVS